VKFDDLLAQFLYQHKTLKLEGIGRFTLEGNVSVPYEQDKEVYYPIEGLSFSQNPKELTDEELVAFLVQKLGKIQPLVRSDLESYLSNVKQFINLGKPYTIEGVGTLHKNNQGIFEFTPGNFLPAKEELSAKREFVEAEFKERRHSERSGSGGRSFIVVLVVLASLAALAALGWGIYYMVTKEKTATPAMVEVRADTVTSLQQTQPSGDSTGTTTSPTIVNSGDTTSYKMIFEVTPSRQRAITRTNYLQTLKIWAKYDSVTTGDSKRYRIYVSKRMTAADTLRVRDSIARFFMKKVTIDK